MTCPFCGADVIVSLDGVPESYECGSGDLRQSKTCQELCRLREKKAKGLEWEMINGYLVAYSVRCKYTVFNANGSACLFEGDLLLARRDSIELAKARAEELHQQAWRELRNKWDAK